MHGSRRKSRWSGRQDSNLRPSGPKPDALPGCATPRTGAERIAKLCGTRNGSGRPLCNKGPTTWLCHGATIRKGGASRQSHAVSRHKCRWPHLREVDLAPLNHARAARWWARQESNPQPSRYERPALPLSYRPPVRARDSAKAFLLASRPVHEHPTVPRRKRYRRWSTVHRHRAPTPQSGAA
jgi:hypothetical protein